MRGVKWKYYKNKIKKRRVDSLDSWAVFYGVKNIWVYLGERVDEKNLKMG